MLNQVQHDEVGRMLNRVQHDGVVVTSLSTFQGLVFAFTSP